MPFFCVFRYHTILQDFAYITFKDCSQFLCLALVLLIFVVQFVDFFVFPILMKVETYFVILFIS